MSRREASSIAGGTYTPLHDRDIAMRLRSSGVRDDNEIFIHILNNVCPRAEAFLKGTGCGAQPQDAEDAVANALKRLWEGAIRSESLYAYTPNGASFQTWFTAVSRNELRKIWRGTGPMKTLDSEPVDHRGGDAAGEGTERRAAEHAKAAHRVAALREKLSPKDRRIIDAFVRSGGGVGSWASNLSKKVRGTNEAMTPNTIRVRFHRVCNRIRNSFLG